VDVSSRGFSEMELRRFATNIDAILLAGRTAQIQRELMVWRDGSQGRAEKMSAATSECRVSLGIIDHKMQGTTRKVGGDRTSSRYGKRMRGRRICVLRLIKDYDESILEAA
jgi:hypothetical protein